MSFSFTGDAFLTFYAKQDKYTVRALVILVNAFLVFGRSGLISRDAISRAKGLIREAVLAALEDEVEFDKWFGGQVTR